MITYKLGGAERSTLSQLTLARDQAKADKKLAEMKKEAADSHLVASETAAALKQVQLIAIAAVVLTWLQAQDRSDQKAKLKLDADDKVIEAEIDGDDDKLIESQTHQATAAEQSSQAKTAAETAEQLAIEAAHSKGEMDEALAHATEEHSRDIGNATTSADRRESGPFAHSRMLLQDQPLTVAEATSEQALAASALENATAALDSSQGSLETAQEAEAALESSLGSMSTALKMTEEEAAAFKERFDALVSSNTNARKAMNRLAKEMAAARKGLAKAEETETGFRDQFEELQTELNDDKQMGDQLETAAHDESPCANGALRMHGQCWYLGAPGASCRETCAAHGGTAYDATVDLADDPVMPHLLKQSEMQVPPKARPAVAPAEVSRGSEYFAAAADTPCHSLPAALPTLTDLSQGTVLDSLAVDTSLMASPTNALVIDLPEQFKDNAAIKGSSGLPIKFTMDQQDAPIYVATENGTLPAVFEIRSETVIVRMPDGSEVSLPVFELPFDAVGHCQMYIASSHQPACNNLQQDQWVMDKDHGGPSGQMTRAECVARVQSWSTTCSSAGQSRLAGQPVTTLVATGAQLVEIPLNRADATAITFFPASTTPPPPPPSLLPPPPPPPGKYPQLSDVRLTIVANAGWCRVKIGASDQQACGLVPKVEWFYDKDFMGTYMPSWHWWLRALESLNLSYRYALSPLCRSRS